MATADGEGCRAGFGRRSEGVMSKHTPGPWRSAWELPDGDMDWEQPLIWSENPDVPEDDRDVVGGMWYDVFRNDE